MALRRAFSVSLLMGLAYLAAGTPSAAQSAAAAFVPDELIVQYRPEVAEARRSQVRSRHRGERLKHFETFNIDHLKLPRGADLAAAIAALRLDADVLNAQLNYITRITPSAPPNDPSWLDGSLWGVERAQAPLVWNQYGAGASTVVVADIDTGVQYNHPDLAANMWRNPGELP